MGIKEVHDRDTVLCLLRKVEGYDKEKKEERRNARSGTIPEP